jgi:TolA-binding protein/TM2 domain-containing membrane protein YozV
MGVKLSNKSSRHLYLSCLLIGVCLALSLRGLAHATPHDANGTQLYDFGLHLFRLGDYYRAVTELKRFTLLFPQHQQRTAAQVVLGLALEGDELYDDAFIHFRQLRRTYKRHPVGQLANFKLGELHFQQRRYREAIEHLQQFLQTFPDAPLAPRSTYLLGLSWALEGQFEQAHRVLDTVPAGHPLGNQAQRLRQSLKTPTTPPTPRKSPRTARILAGLLPGAGHLYLGKPWQGLAAFLLNGSFLTGAVFAFREHLYATGAILLYFETGWYLGNINSAGAGAQAANRSQQHAFTEHLKTTYTPPPLSLPYLQTPALGLRLTF